MNQIDRSESQGHSRGTISADAIKPFDLWLRRLVLIAVCCFIGVSCYFVYRISMVVYRIEQGISRISEDLKQVTGTAANMAKKIDQMVEKVDRLDEKVKDQKEDAEHAIDELLQLHELREKKEGKLTQQARDEIKLLLNEVKNSTLKFGNENDIRSARFYYLRLYAKYKVYEPGLTSAEDFIKMAATETVGGNPYYVVLENGQKQPLQEWLTERLKEVRKRPTGKPAQ